MDDFRRNHRLARRIAIAAMICCSTAHAIADEPAKASGSKPSESLRSLLSQGLNEQPTPIATIEATPANPTAVVTAAPKATPVDVAASPKPADTATTQAAVQPKKVTEPAPTTTSEKTIPMAAKPSGLAELLKPKSKPIVVPQLQIDAATLPSFVDQPSKPIVKRLEVSPERRVMNSEESDSVNAKEATPVLANSDVAKKPATKASESPISVAAPLQFPQPTMSEILEIESATKLAELEAIFSRQQGQAAAEAELLSSMPDSTPATSVEEPLPADLDPQLPEPTIAADESIDHSSAVDNLIPPPVTGHRVYASAPSPATMVHVNRLHQLSHLALQNAKESFKRGATHSARKYATESLRLTVDMQDARDGGNSHAKQLDVALDAIRESEDFCGRFGAVDTRSLERMVAVHETQVLKGHELVNISSMRATEAYLSIAKDGLVAAAGQSVDASDALVMLAIIEKRLAGERHSNAGAVALAMQRAAIEIAPNSSTAHRELGSTLLEQGLVPQAAWALSQSVDLRPTRVGYQTLLEASQRMGDAEMSRKCVAALNDPSLPSGIAIQTLTPDAFAANYRPDPSTFDAKNAKPTEPVQSVSAGEESRVSLRPTLSIGRR